MKGIIKPTSMVWGEKMGGSVRDAQKKGRAEVSEVPSLWDNLRLGFLVRKPSATVLEHL